MRKAISITLSEDNLLWLRGQAARSARGSVSELLDRLVAEARHGGRTDPSAVRSVVGTVDLPDDDSDLSGADGYIRYDLLLVDAGTHGGEGADVWIAEGQAAAWLRPPRP